MSEGALDKRGSADEKGTSVSRKEAMKAAGRMMQETRGGRKKGRKKLPVGLDEKIVGAATMARG